MNLDIDRIIDHLEHGRPVPDEDVRALVAWAIQSHQSWAAEEKLRALARDGVGPLIDRVQELEARERFLLERLETSSSAAANAIAKAERERNEAEARASRLESALVYEGHEDEDARVLRHANRMQMQRAEKAEARMAALEVTIGSIQRAAQSALGFLNKERDAAAWYVDGIVSTTSLALKDAL